MITGKQLLTGNDYIINKQIKIYNPLIREIIKFGVDEYFSMVYWLCGTPYDFKDMLDDIEVDYNLLTNFELFCSMCCSKNLPYDYTKILLGNFNLSKLNRLFDIKTNEIVLSYLNKDNIDIIITEDIYNKIVDCLRRMHGFDEREGKVYSYILKSFSSMAPIYLDLHISTFTTLVMCGAILPKLEVVLDNNQKGKDDKINK